MIFWFLIRRFFVPSNGHRSCLDKSLPCQKYTIKRYCLQEPQNYILRIIYVCSLFFSGLSNSVFSNFYFGFKNFLYLKKFGFHTLVKTCLQRGFEWTKNHLQRKMQNSHTIYLKKRLENETSPKFTSKNFKFGVSIVVSASCRKIKNIHLVSHTNNIHIGEKVCCCCYIWRFVSRFFLKRVQKKCSILWSAWVFLINTVYVM